MMEPQDKYVPLDENDLSLDLAALGYPGFAHVFWDRKPPPRDPTRFLLYVVNQPDVSQRVVDGLPWLIFHFALDLNWEWLLEHTIKHERQNRLGFLVSIAKEYAETTVKCLQAAKLNHYQSRLEIVRLDTEDTLCWDSMPQASRPRRRDRRPPEAQHWNLLADLQLKHLDWME